MQTSTITVYTMSCERGSMAEMSEPASVTSGLTLVMSRSFKSPLKRAPFTWIQIFSNTPWKQQGRTLKYLYTLLLNSTSSKLWQEHGAPLKNWKRIIATRTRDFTSRYTIKKQKKTESKVKKRYLYIHVHSTVYNNQKVEATHGWINQWMDKQNMWATQSENYYSALKSKEILTHDTTWMNLEGMILSEINQTRKGKQCMIPGGGL